MQGHVVVITGASRGIGAELARQLAAANAKLVLAARNEADLASVVNACTAAGASAVAVRADVAVEADCRRIVEAALDTFQRIDTVIHNAGITLLSPFEEIDDFEKIARLMQVNYMGPVYLTRHALPHLRKTRGRLVGINSLTGLTGVPTRSAYSASKHAMRGFFESLRIELADAGVTVTMVYPGLVATGIRGDTGTEPAGMMSVADCARDTIAAMARRDRQLIMTTRGKLGQFLKLLAPGLVDRMARKAVQRAE